MAATISASATTRRSTREPRYGYGHAVTNFVLENNIANYGDYGIMGDNTAPGNGTLSTWFPSAVVLGNVVPNNTQPWTFPGRQLVPRELGRRGVCRPGGRRLPARADERLHRCCTGGSAPGANIDILDAAMTAGTPVVVACTFTA
jgi:hypothetical protein